MKRDTSDQAYVVQHVRREPVNRVPVASKTRTVSDVGVSSAMGSPIR
ncbi:hypothetical protein YT1_0216 [Rhodococcus ruber]|nr:hypothetical protein YT1_0216 [Rhodococcus ruber]CCW12462.1 hypothetical protein EBESD8_30110 [Rhodococcus aetherivorans]